MVNGMPTSGPSAFRCGTAGRRRTCQRASETARAPADARYAALGVQRGLSQPPGCRPAVPVEHLDAAGDVVAFGVLGEIGGQRALAPAMRRDDVPPRGDRRGQIRIALGDHAAGVEHRPRAARGPAGRAAARHRPSGRTPPRTAPGDRRRPASADCPSGRCRARCPSAQPSSITLSEIASGLPTGQPGGNSTVGIGKPPSDREFRREV